jgi:hypothetical protein
MAVSDESNTRQGFHMPASVSAFVITSIILMGAFASVTNCVQQYWVQCSIVSSTYADSHGMLVVNGIVQLDYVFGGGAAGLTSP